MANWPVEIAGNNSNFINTCLGSELVILCYNAEFDEVADEDGEGTVDGDVEDD